MANLTRQSGDAYYYDSSNLMGEYPFTFNKVANVMPGDTIIVRLQYVNVLKYENGQFNLRFPMVVAPRYIDGSRVVGYSGTGWSYDTDIVPDASPSKENEKVNGGPTNCIPYKSTSVHT